MKIKHLLPFFICLVLFSYCVDEIDLGLPSPAEFLVVDGILNYHKDADSTDLVVRLSLSNNTFSRPYPLGKANVELLVNDKDVYVLPERETGNYYLLTKDIFKVGNTYKLRFQVGNEKYESTTETLMDSVPLSRIYCELDKDGTANDAYEVFVDMQDDANKRNYYRWAITQWEQQFYCQFCYRPTSRSPEFCSEDLYAYNPTSTITRNPNCASDCFDILRFTANNAVSDVFINGKQLIKKSVAHLPFISSQPCLVEVKQSSLTPQYFAFLEILKSQAENTGGLADTPAALLVGNVKNLNNSKQKIVGYFSVTNNSVRRYWLIRKDALTAGLTPLSRVNPPLDPPVPTPPSWYPVPCKKSYNRTPVKPWGWQ